LAHAAGLVSADRWQRLQTLEEEIARANDFLATQFHEGNKLEQLLRRPEMDWAQLCAIAPDAAALNLSPRAQTQVTIETKYAGYIRRQTAQIAKQARLANVPIPMAFDYHAVPQLRTEAKEKLSKIAPRDIGHAQRISGITPADLAVVILYLEDPSRIAS